MAVNGWRQAPGKKLENIVAFCNLPDIFDVRRRHLNTERVGIGFARQRPVRNWMRHIALWVEKLGVPKTVMKTCGSIQVNRPTKPSRSFCNTLLGK